MSDSAVQVAAERVILGALSAQIGRPLTPRAVALPGGARVQVDGVADDESAYVEVFARQGALNGGQHKKICQDALKLITLGRIRPDAKLVIAFADEGAATYARTGTWVAEALATWGVDVVVVEIDGTLRDEIRAAQRRQVMINVTSPSAGTFDGLDVVAAGIDGCRAGWIAAFATDGDDQSRPTTLRLFADIDGVAAWHAGQAASPPVGIDVPIGVPDVVGARPCDREARKRLGARWMSVFAVPDRELFGHDFETARAIVHARRAADPTTEFSVLSQQGVAIMDRIAEVDLFARDHPDSERWLIEVHPEVSFAELARHVLPAKSKDSGATIRLKLLRTVFPDIDTQLDAASWAKSKVSTDDILDAYVVLWSTLRFSRGAGNYLQLGGGERDGNGVLTRMIV